MAYDTLVMQCCHAMPVGYCMMVGHSGGRVDEKLQMYDHFLSNLLVQSIVRLVLLLYRKVIGFGHSCSHVPAVV